MDKSIAFYQLPDITYSNNITEYLEIYLIDKYKNPNKRLCCVKSETKDNVVIFKLWNRTDIVFGHILVDANTRFILDVEVNDEYFEDKPQYNKGYKYWKDFYIGYRVDASRKWF